MRMYVANASMQHHEFAYRIPETPKQRQLRIRHMTQELLPDDMNQEQVNSVIEQHEAYGFVSAESIAERNPRKKFTRLVYAIDRPVPSDVIQLLFDQNRGVQTQDGIDIRRTLAVANSEAVLRTLEQQKQDIPALDGDLNHFEMTVQEEEKPGGGFDRPESEVTAEGYDVVGNNPVASAKGRARRS